ncbi:hypothetical protein [Embleya sp. NPDC005971]|uniref:hypothetical protein n=1 Tax=Embleya sp. NPDC005971 TaxID=3156724 RepID=UPI003403E745
MDPSDAPTCAVCGYALHGDQLDRVACRRCELRLDGQLESLPGHYDALADALLPGAQADSTPVSGTRTPPLPVRLEALNLRAPGGMVTILTDWEDDWRRLYGWQPARARGRAEETLDGAVRFLRNNLGWACRQHPAIGEFAGEIGELVARCKAACGARSDAKYIGDCPGPDDDQECGTRLYADPWMDFIRCRRCRSEWPRSEWIGLGTRMHGGTPPTPNRIAS